jgi:hypothetical protein
MTVETTSARSARKPAPKRVPCPAFGCTYTMDSPGSIPAHVAMAHPSRDLDAPACVGSNHVPGCDHFAAPTTSAAASEPGAAPAAGGPVPTELDIDEIVVEDNVREDLGDLEAIVAGDGSVALLGAGR